MRKCIRRIVSVVPVFIYTIYRILSCIPDNLNGDKVYPRTAVAESSYSKSRLEDGLNTAVLNLTEAVYAPDWTGYITNRNYLIDCTNIGEIKLKRRLGFGVSKQGFLGYFKERPVVVKVTRRDLLEVPRCEGNLFPSVVRHKVCEEYSRMKIMKEILTLQEIAHNTIAPLVGFCVKGSVVDSDGMTDTGFVSVIDWGEDLSPMEIVKKHWIERLRIAYGVVEIIDYLAHSPIGSINYPDFKVGHFKMFNSTVKMIDFDMVYNQEQVCGTNIPCLPGLDCLENYCIGHNAKYNLARMRDVFGPLLLRPSSYPKHISSAVARIVKQLDTGLSNTTELVKLFAAMLRV